MICFYNERNFLKNIANMVIVAKVSKNHVIQRMDNSMGLSKIH